MKRRNFLQGMLAALAIPAPFIAPKVVEAVTPDPEPTVYTWQTMGRTVTIQGTFTDEEKQQFIDKTGEYTKKMDAQAKYFKKYDMKP